MEKEQMIEYLKNYNSYKYQIFNLEKELKNIKDFIFEYNIKLTANMDINNDIHSKNKIGDKVYMAVVEMEKRKEQNEKRQAEIEKEIATLKEKVSEVDAFLDALYDHERVAIRYYFIQGRKKFDIGENIFLHEFGVPKSEKTINNIINKAFTKLY